MIVSGSLMQSHLSGDRVVRFHFALSCFELHNPGERVGILIAYPVYTGNLSGRHALFIPLDNMFLIVSSN